MTDIYDFIVNRIVFMNNSYTLTTLVIKTVVSLVTLILPDKYGILVLNKIHNSINFSNFYSFIFSL